MSRQELGQRWFEVRLVAAPEMAEPLYGLLDGFEVTGLEEQATGDGLELRAFFRADTFGELADLRRALAEALERLPGDLPRPRVVHMRDFRDRDWAKAWLQFTEALALTPEIWVRPSWARLPEGVAPRLVIDLDPGMAFGTGQHATTRLATGLLAERIAKGEIESVLDLGCGSGLLAIVAARLGAPRVAGVEIDPVAAEIARENARSNAASEVEVLTGSLESVDLERADLVVANLNSGLLVEHAARLVALTRPGGELIVSGILAGTEARVAEALVAGGAHVIDQRTEEGWTALLLSVA